MKHIYKRIEQNRLLIKGGNEIKEIDIDNVME